MTSESFNKLVEACCKEIRETLSKKAGDYAGEDNRLQNFLDTAAMNGVSPEWALWGMVSKHIIALKDYVKELDTPGKFASEFQLLEKTGDIIAYTVLLRGLLIDRGLIKEYAERNGV